MSVRTLTTAYNVGTVTPDGVRWCFRCRRRVQFSRTMFYPQDERSYYGPHEEIRCTHGHLNGDQFPFRR